MNGDVTIAYETVGDRSVDPLYLAPITNLEIIGENPDLAAGSGILPEDAGEHELKGVPDTWRLFGW